MNLRREARQALAMNAKFRTPFDRAIVEVRNLTQYGCQIVGNWGYLKGGSRVMLRPDGFESFPGAARWVLQDRVGIEFDKPLNSAIVDHLCNLHPTPETERE